VNGFQFLAEIIGSLVWPATVIFAIFRLRDPLVRLLPKLRFLRYKGLELDFGEELKKVETEVSKLPLPDRPALQPFDEASEQRFRDVADLSPNYAVFEAWINVERALKELAKSSGHEFRRGSSPIYLTRVLRQREVIDQQTASLLDELRVLRNLAIHPEGERPVTFDEAARYKEMADGVVVTLSTARRGAADQPRPATRERI